MRWDDIFIAATAVETGTLATPSATLRSGDGETYSVSIEQNRYAPELAATAARRAVGAMAPGGRFRLVLHCSVGYQGAGMWSASSFVAAGSVGEGVPAVDFQQQCNAALGALELSAGLLTGWRDQDMVLITTGDRFAEPLFDRWSRDRSTVFGDAGTAMAVGRRPAELQLVATATRSDHALEGILRGGQFWPEAQRTQGMDMTALTDRFLASGVRLRDVILRLTQVATDAVESCLADASVTIDDVAYTVMGFAFRDQFERRATKVVGVPLERTNWDYASTVGHFGPGDQIAGLDHLVRSGKAGLGDYILLLGGGAGVNCTAALVRVVGHADPSRPRPGDAV